MFAQALKLFVEVTPVLVFFTAYKISGIMDAVVYMLIAVAVALVLYISVVRKAPILLILSSAIILVMGGLTIFTGNTMFIKMKPTILNASISFMLLLDLWLLRKNILSRILGGQLKMHDYAWRKITIRCAIFFLSIAAMNEIVWRFNSEEFWVNFKVFGIFPLILLFALSQIPYMKKHLTEEINFK